MKKTPTPSVGETDISVPVRGEAPDPLPITAREDGPAAPHARPHGPMPVGEYETALSAGRTGYCMSCGAFQGGTRVDAANVSPCQVCGITAVVGAQHAIDTGVLTFS